MPKRLTEKELAWIREQLSQGPIKIRTADGQEYELSEVIRVVEVDSAEVDGSKVVPFRWPKAQPRSRRQGKRRASA